MTVPYEGDPKIYLTDNGADWEVENGDPVREQGIENELNYSLFTRENWPGNIYLTGAKKVGSAFERKSSGVITARTPNDVRQECLNSFDSGIYGENECTVVNPSASVLKVEYIVRPPNSDPKVFLFTKNGINWKSQLEKGST
jgi:hypothetical protein